MHNATEGFFTSTPLDEKKKVLCPSPSYGL
jgi:hypothetical protein